MNPHASYKCAGRLLMALAAVTSILVISGCGGSSSSTPPPNQSGFSNSSLSGTYVFSSQGADVNGYPVAIAGSLVANGSGGSNSITGGTIDIVDPDPDFTPLSPVAQSVSGGSYNVNTDGRGQASLTSSYGTYVFDFVLSSTSHGLISEYDTNGTGSGTIDLQTAITSLSQLAGSYAFSLGGSDASGNPFAIAGAFTLGSSGNITAGTEDFNDNLIVENESLNTAGVATLGSGTGPGTIPLSSSTFPITFDYYPIDSTHIKLIETDYTYGFIGGDAFTQTGASSIPTTAMAFTVSGGITVPIAAGGTLTVSGTSVSGTEDTNAGGTVVTGTTFTGVASTPGSVGGRVVVSSLNGFNPATKFVLYPSTGGNLLLEIDGANLTVGAAFAQTAGAAIAASQNYGLNLTATNTSNGAGAFFEEDDIAQFLTSSSGFSGIVDINDEGTTTFDQPLTGTYPSATSVTTSIGSNEFVSFNFYPVSNSQFLLLETDNDQIGIGSFELQSAPSSAAASHRAISMVRPAARVHMVKRRK
jgi:hypothetical protein